MTLKALRMATTSHDYNRNMLAISTGPWPSVLPTAPASERCHSALSEKHMNFGEDSKNEDSKDIQELGQGNRGSFKRLSIPLQG